eukprot:tig00020563_g11281.t1
MLGSPSSVFHALNIVLVVLYAADAALRFYARGSARVLLGSATDLIDVLVALLGIVQLGLAPRPGSSPRDRPALFLYPFRVFRFTRILRNCRFKTLRALAVDSGRSLRAAAGSVRPFEFARYDAAEAS